MLSRIETTIPQWTAGIRASAAGLAEIGEADRDDEKCFEPFAEGDDERLQHDRRPLENETDLVFKAYPRISDQSSPAFGRRRQMPCRRVNIDAIMTSTALALLFLLLCP